MKKIIMPESFTVTAHTGCEGTPDNSIESVDKAFESGADIFEIDVNFDEKGVPVLSHDTPRGGEPELEEVFKKLREKKKIKCNLDIKSTDNLKMISVLAEKYSVIDRVFYTGVRENDVESVKKDTPQITYYLNADVLPPRKQTQEYLLSLVKKVRDSGATGINFHYKNVTSELVEFFHQSGLLVSVWTVNKIPALLRILKLKPDNITTRKPALLKRMLACSK